MKEVSSLARDLKAHLPWHQARIVFLAQFMLSLLRSRSCNFYRVAEAFQSKAQTESSYRRIKRFFAGYTYCYEQLGRLILHWLNLDRYTLCMDRTNWQFGSKHINYLVVSIVWQSASIPIVWRCLDKEGGNSSTKERIALMQHLLTLIPAEKIDNLLADREFIGKHWFQWLAQQGICYRLRIKSNATIQTSCGKQVKAEQLFWSLRLNESMVCRGTRQVSGIDLYLAGRRTNKGLLIVVSSQKPEMMIEDYYQRWHIETLFGCLKSRGFDLEATHMTELDRMDKLMGILALTFTWCLLTGHHHHGEAKQLPLNRHYRPAKSLFRLGLDMLRRVLLNTQSKHDSVNFLLLLKVLSRT